MNWKTVEGEWDQFKGRLRSRWGKLTDDDLATLGGKKDQLVGILQTRYGLMKDEAERQLDDWIRKLDKGASKKKEDAPRSRPGSL